MMNKKDLKYFNRRTFVSSASASILALPSRTTLAAVAVTPSQTAGPFYPDHKDLFADIDNDLVLIASKARKAGGTILHLRGAVRDPNGHALSDQGVEIWQCDINGRYLSRTDWSITRSRDAYFQGFGTTRTDADGHYNFRTIRPVPYSGRTPHIHVKVRSRSGDELTTQMYVAGDAGNANDGLYNDLSTAERRRVTVDLRQTNGNDLEGVFDIVVPWQV